MLCKIENTFAKYVCIDPGNNPKNHIQRVTRNPAWMNTNIEFGVLRK